MLVHVDKNNKSRLWRGAAMMSLAGWGGFTWAKKKGIPVDNKNVHKNLRHRMEDAEMAQVPARWCLLVYASPLTLAQECLMSCNSVASGTSRAAGKYSFLFLFCKCGDSPLVLLFFFFFFPLAALTQREQCSNSEPAGCWRRFESVQLATHPGN